MSKWLIWTLLEMSIVFVSSSLMLLWLILRLKKRVDKSKGVINKQAEKNLSEFATPQAYPSANNTTPNEGSKNNSGKLSESNLEVYDYELTQAIKRLVDHECRVEEKKTSNTHLMITLEHRRTLNENAKKIKAEITTVQRQNQQLESTIARGISKKKEVAVIKELIDEQIFMVTLFHNKTGLHNKLFESESRLVNLEKVTRTSALLRKNIDQLDEVLVSPTSPVEISTS